MGALFPNQILKPLEKDGVKSWCVTVDLDVWFEYFLRKSDEVPADQREGITLEYIRSQIRNIEAVLNRPIVSHYRRSSRGHTHIRLDFAEEITVFDGFLLRACLFDDLMRLTLDQSRYALHDSLEKLNKCFDEKADGGKFYVSGPWIPINKGRDDLTGDAKADWLQYWDSIGREYHKPENHINLVKSHWKELSPPAEKRTVTGTGAGHCRKRSATGAGDRMSYKSPTPPFLFVCYLGLIGGMIAGGIAKSEMSVVIVFFALMITGGFVIGRYGPERDLV